MTLTQSSFTENLSATGGGAIVHSQEWGNLDISAVITACTFISNTGFSHGGAIWAGSHGDRGDMFIADSTFIGNRARSFRDDCYDSGASGGAISNSDMTLTLLRNEFRGNSACLQGGALLLGDAGNRVPIKVTQCSFSDNSAGERGGAVAFDGNALVVQDSLFTGNQVINTEGCEREPCGLGGGLYIEGFFDPPVRVENSTFFNNGATGQGGGLFVGAPHPYCNCAPLLQLEHVTIAGNVAPTAGGLYVGSNATLHYTNTLIADNYRGNGARGVDCVLAGSLGANVNNLVQDGSCYTNSVGFLSGDPRLGPLSDLGVPRVGANHDALLRVLPLRAGSPALDSAPVLSGTLSADQRGAARPQGAARDRGAYERGPLHLALTATPAVNAPLGGLVTFTLVLTNTGGILDPAVALTATLPDGLAFAALLSGPSGATTATQSLWWQGSLASGAAHTWQFTARNTGAFNQPGEYGDALLTTATVSGATDPGNWVDTTVVVECDPDPLSVDNLHNAGPCSLRQVLADAPDGATLTFRPELAGQTILLVYPNPYYPAFGAWLPRQNSTLVITRDVTVDASALPAPVTLDGNDDSRILLVTNNARVTLHHLTLTHGNQYVNDTCWSPIHAAGGAIKIEPGAALTLTHSAVVSNTANYRGGGIANYGRLTALYSTIANNVVHGSVYPGAGLYNGKCDSAHAMGPAVAELTYSSVTGNYSSNEVGDAATRYLGGGILNDRATLTVTHCLISGNHLGRFGRGMGLANSLGVFLVRDSTFTNNYARNLVSTNGGGLYNAAGYGAVHNSTFSGNAAYYGGAIFTTSYVTMTHNTIIGNYGDMGSAAYGSYWYMYNNLIANNGPAAQCYAPSSLPLLQANVNNLISDGSCGAGSVGLLTGDPLLGPLVDYGGPRVGPNEDLPLLTYPLLTASPAIDTAAFTYTLPTDGRGLPRADLRGDIGAYELQHADSDTVVKTFGDTPTHSFGPTWVSVTLSLTDTGALTVTKHLACPGGTCDPGELLATWHITSALSEGLPLTVSFCYTQELAAVTDEASVRAFRWDSDAMTWTLPISTGLTVADGCLILTGITEFSAWTLKDTSVGADTPTAARLVGLAAQGFAPVAVLLALGVAAALRRKR